METKFRKYKDGCIWINASIFIHEDDIYIDHSYTRNIQNSNDTETVTHYYTEEQQQKMIDYLRSEISNEFERKRRSLLENARDIVGDGERIEIYAN